MQLYQIKFCFFCVLHRHSYNLTQIYLYCGSQLLAYSWFAGELRLALVHKDQSKGRCSKCLFHLLHLCFATSYCLHNSQNIKLSRPRIFFSSLFVQFLTQWSPNPCVLHYKPTNYCTFLVVKRTNQTGRRLNFISKGSTEEMTQMNILWSNAPKFAGSINDLLQASLS